MIKKQKIFDSYSRYYDLLYQDKDYKAEAIYIKNLLKKHKVPKGDLLEFGSGTGIHGRLLGEMGYHVHGIERSIEMVEQSIMTSGFSCEHGDISIIKTGRTYDAVLSLFHVISYQISNTSILSVFKRAAEHLKPGGVFIFDYWYSPAVYTKRPEVRIKRMSDEKVDIIRIAEPVIIHNDNRVNVNFTIYARDRQSSKVTTFCEEHPMRHYSIPEIALLSQISGFELIESEEFLTKKNS